MFESRFQYTLIGRHTAACYLLNEKGLSMDVVARILGHATTKITRHYAKLMDETVLEAVERADMLASSYSPQRVQIRPFLFPTRN